MVLRPVLSAFGLLAATIISTPPALAQQPSKSSIHVRGGVPVLPRTLEASINRYRFFQNGHLQGWLAATEQILYLTESEGTQQAFVGRDPGSPGQQLTDTRRPVAWAYSHPRLERVIIAQDTDGNEKNQLTLFNAITGGASDSPMPTGRTARCSRSRLGRMLALTSNARNAKDGDLYVIDPLRHSTGRKLKDATGTLLAQSWSPNSRRLAAIEQSPDWREARVHLIDVETGQAEMLPQPVGPPVKRLNVRWSPDGGSLYWLTDRGSDFLYLAKYDLASRTESRLWNKLPWDIEVFSLADDGTAAALVVNEDGRSRLHLIDPRTGREIHIPPIADGHIGSVIFRRMSTEFAFEWSCTQSPPGIYAYDLATGRETEWIRPAPVDPHASERPDHVLFRYRSFDGRQIPAFIRRPGPMFPGRRPYWC